MLVCLLHTDFLIHLCTQIARLYVAIDLITTGTIPSGSSGESGSWPVTISLGLVGYSNAEKRTDGS